MSEVSIPSKGLQLLAELERAGAITETSLSLPPGISYDKYEALVTMFGQLHRTSAWLLGDALNYGEKVYGETYTQAAIWTGLSEHTLANYASTCGRLPRSRRRKNLPFSIHAEVAWLTPEEQDDWLERASSSGWTRSIMREELAPMRAAKELELSRSKRSPQGADCEIIPPAVSHICQCFTCGRYHRDDLDVDVED